MKKQSILVQKQGVAFAEDKKIVRCSQTLQITHSKPKKLPKIDEMLEDTLIGANTTKKLTKRELQILNLIVAGKTNKQIAHIFDRTQRTIEYHRNCLMRKFDAHNAAQLVKKALKMGIKLP